MRHLLFAAAFWMAFFFGAPASAEEQRAVFVPVLCNAEGVRVLARADVEYGREFATRIWPMLLKAHPERGHCRLLPFGHEPALFVAGLEYYKPAGGLGRIWEVFYPRLGATGFLYMKDADGKMDEDKVSWKPVIMEKDNGFIPANYRHQAQQICGMHTNVAKALEEQHTETPIAMGVAASGGVVQVYASPDGKTWTMVVTKPNGLTCMLASGESWENIKNLVRGPQT